MKTSFLGLAFFSLFLLLGYVFASDETLPLLGRDTVLVYRTQIQDSSSDFVVRIAEFAPDRFVEWEDSKNQGTVFMPLKILENSKSYTDSNLFVAGVEKVSPKATTIWLSKLIFRELKEKKKIKIEVDSLASWMSLEGTESVAVEVNNKILELPAIKTKDDRKSERWFLDSEENPILLKHQVRFYTQKLASITTNRTNTLRWIKGKKLNRQ